MTNFHEAAERVVQLEADDNARLEKIKANARSIVDAELAQDRAELAQQETNARWLHAWINILRAEVSGRGFVANNAANETVVKGWLNFDETPSVKWFLDVLKNNPSLGNKLVWESATSRNPASRKQKAEQELERDRQTFDACCRRFGFGNNTANFQLIREVLGPGFSMLAVGNAIQNNAIRPSPATSVELAEWAEESAEAEKLALLNAPIDELRKRAKQEAAATRQSDAERELQLRLETERIRDAAIGYPPLPKSITKFQLKDLGDADFLRRMIRKYGPSQITTRLNEKD